MSNKKKIFTEEKKFKLSFLLMIIGLILYMLLWGFFFEATLNIVNANNISISQVIVGNVYPEVSVIIDEGAASVSLTEGGNKSVICNATVVDYNGEETISNVNATFWDSGGGTLITDPDDNNNHYTNPNCTLDLSYGDTYTLMAICQFNVTYYANNNTWTCQANVTDNTNLSSVGNDTIDIDPLVALDIPTTIDYGTVNALEVSSENITNVSNWGNVQIDLNIEGYGWNNGDGVAMICTLGNVGNISLEYERYNVTDSTSGTLNLTTFNNTYVGITDSPVLEQFNLAQRQNDLINDAIKSSYWRLYVPLGVAGTCNGTVIMAAVSG